MPAENWIKFVFRRSRSSGRGGGLEQCPVRSVKWSSVGRPPREGYERVIELGLYQAETWAFPQRLLLVVIDAPDPKTGQLFLEPDYFFLLSGWDEAELDGEGCLAHYRKRGTFEDRLGEFNQALGCSCPARSSARTRPRSC